MPDYVKSDSDELKTALLPVKLDPKLSIETPELGGELKFLRMPSSNIPDFLDFLSSTKLHRSYGDAINITGGGAYKFEAMIKNKLGFKVHKTDEMSTAIKGLNFLVSHVKKEVFAFRWDTNEQVYLEKKQLGDVYPYLLVNIGSGVSILRCTGENEFERVSGSSLGGGMFWGLCKLLTGITKWDDVKTLSSQGDNAKVDLLVGDIYGTSYESIGLPADVIASSFGKLASLSEADLKTKFGKGDVIRSLLFMTANNIAQIAYLNAARYDIKRVFFAGNFINRNAYVWHRLSYALGFWSKKTMQVVCLMM